MSKTKSGYVSIIGRPNVGKSTLLNRIIGEKLAGVSPKPQTTRGSVRGIHTTPQGQIVFFDTAGLHEPRDPLGKWMVQDVEKCLSNADLVYWMVLPEPPEPFEEKILEIVKKLTVPVFLVVNQIDRFQREEMLPILDFYSKAYPFRELIPISAKRVIQIDLLLEKTFEHLPEGPMLFPEDQISDQNERDIVSEMIREKLFHFTGEEIPYSSAVKIDVFKDRNDKLTDIEATIFVERDSQKAIVIGKQGHKLKEIGQAARLDIEKFIGKKVFLQLWVKTLDQWKKDPNALKRLGYQ